MDKKSVDQNPSEVHSLRSPRPWIFDLGLKPRALGLACAIIQWTLPDGWCWFSIRKLAERLRWSPRTTQRGYSDLIRSGVARRRGGKGKLGICIADRPTVANAGVSEKDQTVATVANTGVIVTPPLTQTVANGGTATIQPIKHPIQRKKRGKKKATPVAPLPLIPGIAWSKVNQSVEATPAGKSYIEKELDLHSKELDRLDNNGGPLNVKLDDADYYESFRRLSAHLQADARKRGPKTLPMMTVNWLKTDLTRKRERMKQSRGRGRKAEPKGLVALREYEESRSGINVN